MDYQITQKPAEGGGRAVGMVRPIDKGVLIVRVPNEKNRRKKLATEDSVQAYNPCSKIPKWKSWLIAGLACRRLH